jgi:hypothetical protein
VPEAPHCCRAQVPSAGPRWMPAHQHMLFMVKRASSCSIGPVTNDVKWYSYHYSAMSVQVVHSVHSAPAAHLQPRVLDHMANVSFTNIGGLVSDERLVRSVPDLCAHCQTGM